MSSFFSPILNLSLCTPSSTVCISGLTAIIVYANNFMDRNSFPKLRSIIQRQKIKHAYTHTHTYFQNMNRLEVPGHDFHCPGCWNGWYLTVIICKIIAVFNNNLSVTTEGCGSEAKHNNYIVCLTLFFQKKEYSFTEISCCHE